ncbi:MAG: response regulator [Proteobacteria bacterium]|nr:response regulator [Pseudomonadota bacterium]
MNFNSNTILIIDDNSANLGVISDFLEAAGFEILAAHDGGSGLAIAREVRPDLILLDVIMPGIDGFETCRRLKADAGTRAIPVIFMTALTDTANKVSGFEAGGVDYITKPFQLEEVLARVKTHLSLHTLQVQLQQAHDELETRVSARTAELRQANMQLKDEINERKAAEAEIRHRNLDLAVLNRVIAASVTESQATAILETACRELAQAFDLPRSAAFLLNADKTEATVVAEYQAPDSAPDTDPPSILNTIFPVADNPAAQHLIELKAPLLIDDVHNDPDRLVAISNLVRKNTRSLLLTPLIIKGETVGGLSLAALEPHGLKDEQVRLAQSVADQVAGVLSRFRLDEERRQLEDQYHQAQKMEALGKLTGGVAHDFNNLLTVIIGVAELLCFDQEPDSPLVARIKQIKVAAERAADLVRQLLAFSRQQILQPRIINVNDVVADFEKMLRRVIGEDIALETVLDQQLGQVKADPGQIEQVLMNLVVNARDAMPKGGSLTIETADVYLDEDYARRHVGVAPGPYARLAVSDTGTGMDAEMQTRIFEPFYTTKSKGQGTGLGLATVHGIVNQSGGHIWVYSELGHGTTFKVYLPRSEVTEERPTHRETAKDAACGSETILVVEDDQGVRELVQEILSDFGYQVLPADCGETARRICAEHEGPIHLMLTDVVMPGGQSGPQVAEVLALQYPQMKVLYMSGYTDSAIVHHGILDPDIAFIHKPFMPIDLAVKVRETLRAKKTEGE